MMDPQPSLLRRLARRAGRVLSGRTWAWLFGVLLPPVAFTLAMDLDRGWGFLFLGQRAFVLPAAGVCLLAMGSHLLATPDAARVRSLRLGALACGKLIAGAWSLPLLPFGLMFLLVPFAWHLAALALSPVLSCIAYGCAVRREGTSALGHEARFLTALLMVLAGLLAPLAVGTGFGMTAILLENRVLEEVRAAAPLETSSTPWPFGWLHEWPRLERLAGDSDAALAARADEAYLAITGFHTATID